MLQLGQAWGMRSSLPWALTMWIRNLAALLYSEWHVWQRCRFSPGLSGKYPSLTKLSTHECSIDSFLLAKTKGEIWKMLHGNEYLALWINESSPLSLLYSISKRLKPNKRFVSVVSIGVRGDFLQGGGQFTNLPYNHRCARGIYSLLMSRLMARICTPPQREKYTPPLKSIHTPPRNPGKMFEIFFNKFYASVVFL